MTRLSGAATLLVALVGIELAAPDLFLPIVAAVLLVCPVIQWTAYLYFRRRSREDPSIVSLRIRVADALSLAFASTAGAVLGWLVLGRAVSLLPSIDRSVFLVGIAFAMLLLPAPAINAYVAFGPSIEELLGRARARLRARDREA